MKKIIALLFALALLCSLALPAYAHDAPQERTDCKIEVIVRYNGEDVKDGTLTAIRVGIVDEEDGDFFFSQEMTGNQLTDISSTGAPGTMEEFYRNNKENHDFYAQTQTVKDGKATFSGLSTGLYLIVQEKAAAGFSKLKPFLVGVPYLENGEYKYEVTAAIKSEVEREPESTPPPSTKQEGPKLPQTGQLNWPVPVLAVSGLAIFTLGWFLRKKEERYEK